MLKRILISHIAAMSGPRTCAANSGCLEEVSVEAVLSWVFSVFEGSDSCHDFFFAGAVLTSRSVSGCGTSISIVGGVLIICHVKEQAHESEINFVR